MRRQVRSSEGWRGRNFAAAKLASLFMNVGSRIAKISSLQPYCLLNSTTIAKIGSLFNEPASLIVDYLVFSRTKQDSLPQYLAGANRLRFFAKTSSLHVGWRGRNFAAAKLASLFMNVGSRIAKISSLQPYCLLDSTTIAKIGSLFNEPTSLIVDYLLFS
ncbi:hypothetical protein [Paenibacillus radicis (ex Gao et al. 2016)]|uniref:hypothetical protein n=1 Tax=Paenibacillus radicis (ex Gao et al. 2016) TaxID=1737354 RepID=UPI001663E668|nr:hypothetical protein [Paenibacillus radicis (ex Gao et al. 2016)]